MKKTLQNSADKLKALRVALAEAGLDGFIIPHEDEFQNEYLPPCNERLAWLTGFTGSAGMAVVLKDEAVVMSDGRYTLQLPQEVDTTLYALDDHTKTKLHDWLPAHAKAGDKIGYDPRLHTQDTIKALKKALARKKIELVAMDNNPLDAVWHDRPAPPASAVEIFPEAIAGRGVAEKIALVADAVTENGGAAFILSGSQSVAWLLNIRGTDVAHMPLALSQGVVHENGIVDWYIDPARVSAAVRKHLGNHVTICDPADMNAGLRALAAKDKPVLIDGKRTSSWFARRIEDHGGKTDNLEDPCVLLRACKTEAEIRAIKTAHVRDGVAMCRFLKWLDDEAVKGDLTEIDVAERLESFRRLDPAFRDSSFDTIAGWAQNGAIVHYRATPATNAVIQPPGILLLDSGAQYQDGTTDITRTIAVGDVAPEMKEHNTRVLKGHIAVASARFPEGTRGVAIDAYARKSLWDAGLDYDHGTGHGVGCYLSVHEEAASISKRGTTPLKAGMLISNEPGFYKSGAYGIRIESLVLVKEDGPRHHADDQVGMLAFETVTLAPIDTRLITPDLLDDSEREWLNAYHARVYETLSLLLEPDVKTWLKAATAPLKKNLTTASTAKPVPPAP